MRPPIASATFLLTLLTTRVSAILAPDGSICSVKCGNVQQSTHSEDIACGDGSFKGQPGLVQKECVECQLNSTEIYEGEMSDTQAAIYNIRYTAGFCIFNDTKVSGSQCVTEYACGQLRNALNYESMGIPSSTLDYGYCDTWDENMIFKCQSCLRALGSQMYLINHIIALNAACRQRPAESQKINLDGSIFDTNLVRQGDPLASASAVASTFHPPTGISLEAKCGIAVGALIVVLIFSGCFIVCRGKRRRRSYLAKFEAEKYGRGAMVEGNRFGVNYTGGDMKQVPKWKKKQAAKQEELKQKRQAEKENNSPGSISSHSGFNKLSNYTWPSPIDRGGETPVSALEPTHTTWSPYLSPSSATEPPGHQKAFSPYISQMGSPVSPGLTPEMMQGAKNGQWGAVPIPRPYRRGSVSTMSGRVEEGEQIEMSPMSGHGNGQSAEEQERWGREAAGVGFVPAPPPVIKAPSHRNWQGHARSVSAESIGEAL